MKNPPPRSQVAPAFLVFLAVALAALPCPSAAEEPAEGLRRTIDNIVLTGSELGPLQGKSVDALRLLAYEGGSLVPIPYQIDEKDPEGVYVFRTSDPAARDDDAGRLDANDELAFMAKDMGGRLPPELFDRYGILFVIEATDPVDGRKGWCYVGPAARFPDRSPVDYVTYDPAGDRILARAYHLGFSEEAPISYADTTVTAAGGGNGARLNERVLTRLQAKVLRMFKIMRSEADFRSSRKGYIDGRVRVIKRVGNSMRQVFGIYGPEVVVDYTFYYSHWIMPSIIDLPVDVGKFVSKLSLRAGTAWTQASRGMVFYTKYIPPGVAVIDGHMSEQEKNMDLRLDIDHIWHLYTGALNHTGQGSILFRILMDKNLQKSLVAKTYFCDRYDDPDYEDDPVTEKQYKLFFEGSYVWSGMEKLSKGRYYLTSWASVMPDYAHPGDENRYLDVLDRPLRLALQPAEPTAVSGAE